MFGLGRKFAGRKTVHIDLTAIGHRRRPRQRFEFGLRLRSGSESTWRSSPLITQGRGIVLRGDADLGGLG